MGLVGSAARKKKSNFRTTILAIARLYTKVPIYKWPDIFLWGAMTLFLCFNTQTLHIMSNLDHNSIAMIAVFEPGFSVHEANAMSTVPRLQGTHKASVFEPGSSVHATNAMSTVPCLQGT
jgi:hypothetical protein